MTVHAEPREPSRSALADGRGVAIDGAALAALEGSFRGELIRPADAGYDVHRRVWNGSIDRHPAVIARCRGEADVVAAIRFARVTGLPVAVRSGGHSFPGLSVCDDGIVIDLRLMNGIRIDQAAGIVHAEAGVLLGELDAATQAHGLAVPVGAVTHTGLAGLTLGGGIGWLMRKHGLTIDQLVAVQVATADGDVLTASETENADLFWGVRGGGGNFGVVTEFAFNLLPVGPEVVGGLFFWALEDAIDVARFYRDWCADLPDEITTALVFRRAPAFDVVPAHLHGRPVVGVVGCWSGQLNQGEAYLQPMRTFGRPVLDLWDRRPFVDVQSMLDMTYPHGLWVYLRSCDVERLSDDVIDVAVDQARKLESNRSTVTIWQLGGAVARVGAGETAFGSRSSGHVFNIAGATGSADGFERERTWARGYWDALSPHQVGAYVNFLMDEGDERVRDAYGVERYARLAELKRRYDPDNFFRLNQNIVPA